MTTPSSPQGAVRRFHVHEANLYKHYKPLNAADVVLASDHDATIAQLAEANASLRQQLAEARKDAERYRCDPPPREGVSEGTALPLADFLQGLAQNDYMIDGRYLWAGAELMEWARCLRSPSGRGGLTREECEAVRWGAMALDQRLGMLTQKYAATLRALAARMGEQT